jgi:hypothetical protein
MTSLPVPAARTAGSDEGDTPEKRYTPVTKSNLLEDFNLTDHQFHALCLTIDGQDDTMIASQLGVSRMTLWRWKTHDEDYRCALATLREQARDSVADYYENQLHTMAVVLANIASERVDRKDSLRACEIFLRYATQYLRPRDARPQQRSTENDAQKRLE